MTRRPGLSLTEVLVALFIMGIGCIAILTLFPLGAMNMAQAFRDDRCTQGVYQADALLRTYVKTARDQGRLTNERFYEALNDPDTKRTASNYLLTVVAQPADSPPPSYPVVIDPLGFRARGGTDDSGNVVANRTWFVGDNGFGDGRSNSHKSALARRSLRSITGQSDVAKQQPLAIRTCSLLDGFGYDTNGQPATVGGGTSIDRDLRYNWLWVVQRMSGQTASEATMTVVVFDKRAPNFAPPGVALETVWIPSYAVADYPHTNPARRKRGETTVRFDGSYAANTLPTVQRGGWLMDASIALIDRSGTTGGPVVVPLQSTGSPPAKAEPWVRNANFYRVVSVTETTTGIDVELESPLRADTGPNQPPFVDDPELPLSERRFIFLSGVAEVFDRQVPLELQ